MPTHIHSHIAHTGQYTHHAEVADDIGVLIGLPQEFNLRITFWQEE